MLESTIAPMGEFQRDPDTKSAISRIQFRLSLIEKHVQYNLSVKRDLFRPTCLLT